MPGYANFGYGYRANQPGAYGYRPQARFAAPVFGGSEYEFDYWNQNPQAVIGQYLGANQVSGPQGVAPDMRSFLENYLPGAYKEYTGWNAANPEKSFADYLGMQDLTNQYEMTNPGARSLRAGYRTRYLKR
jgi:hypothetical protein